MQTPIAAARATRRISRMTDQLGLVAHISLAGLIASSLLAAAALPLLAGRRTRGGDTSRASQARLAGILDIAEDAIISVDARHQITLFNQGAERIFGYSAEEILGRPLDLLLPARFTGVHNAHLAEFAGSPETARKMGGRREIFGLRKDGSEFPAEASISKLDLEGEKIFTVILRDITERKRAEEMIRASQARLAGILDTADDAIISLDKDQRITLFNQGAEKIFGYAAPEILGKPLEALLPERFTGVHRGHIAEFAGSAETARKMGERRDIFGLRRDGSEFPAEASISKLELEGETTFTAILREITERKQFEQALQEKNVELENAILVKDRFLASMSHELRTPLNAIIGFTGTMLMRLPGPLTAGQEKQLQTIQTSAGHLLSLIADLLDLAKIESGKVELNLEPVACESVINEVATALGPMAATKGLTFEVKVPTESLVVMTDRRAITQILLNLANNAIKFTERGRVTIELNQTLRNGASLTGISVIDTGIGIRAEDQEKLFEAFTQVEAMGARRYEGSGLGLHLSRKLASLLGGSISLESEFGKGSNFTLLLGGE
jgi:PAS domain S-box-containing protein